MRSVNTINTVNIWVSGLYGICRDTKYNTFPSGLLFSTQISSVEVREGAAAGEAEGGIPGGKIIPGGGGMALTGGGMNGGL